MNVKGKIFYHIHQKNSYSKAWKVGKIVKTKVDPNYFSKLRYADLHRISDQIRNGSNYLNKTGDILRQGRDFYLSIPSLAQNTLAIESSNHTIKLVRTGIDLRDCLTSYIRILTEILFEVERHNNFPDLPSRKKCFWLTDKGELIKWLRIFNLLNHKDSKKVKIFKVKAYGNVHKTDGVWMTPDVYTATEIYERANKYWSGELATSTKERLPEYLLEGKVEIIDEFMIEDLLKK